MFMKTSNEYLKIKELNKYLSKNEYSFLCRLYFWSSHPKEYGIRKNGEVWIYNTLDDWAKQIGISKSSVRRAIGALKGKKILLSTQLSPNKRDRTLYYAISYENVKNFLHNQLSTKVPSCAQKIEGVHEHKDEHMYIEDNSKQKVNKSNKSDENSEKEVSEHPKPTIIQDMLEIWNEEFSKKPVTLDKTLARFLVAAFKTKFNSHLDKWRKYLKALKTSAFITSKEFKLSIRWAIKFPTIDRIREGWLGTNEDKIPVDTTEIEQKVIEHIEKVQESPKCKAFRRKIAQIFSPAIYISWFTNVQLLDETKGIIIKTSSNFMTDYISTHFFRDFEGDISAIITSTSNE